MPTLAPSSTSKPWERPTGTPFLLLHCSTPHPSSYLDPAGKKAEPFVCGLTLPTGPLASLSLSFHLGEMGYFFPLLTDLAGW